MCFISDEAEKRNLNSLPRSVCCAVFIYSPDPDQEPQQGNPGKGIKLCQAEVHGLPINGKLDVLTHCGNPSRSLRFSQKNDFGTHFATISKNTPG